MSTIRKNRNLIRAGKSQIIESVMSFPMDDVLKKYCEEQSLPMKVAREHEREIKRFLALIAINPKTTYGMKGPIDELWHTFVLFTKKYTDFCYGVSGRYLHHFPSVPGEKPTDSKHYRRLLHDYKLVFGEEPPPHFWPRPKKSTKDLVWCGCGGTCRGCGICPEGCWV
jgi:hypothetical protein